MALQLPVDIQPVGGLGTRGTVRRSAPTSQPVFLWAFGLGIDLGHVHNSAMPRTREEEPLVPDRHLRRSQQRHSCRPHHGSLFSVAGARSALCERSPVLGAYSALSNVAGRQASLLVVGRDSTDVRLDGHRPMANHGQVGQREVTVYGRVDGDREPPHIRVEDLIADAGLRLRLAQGFLIDFPSFDHPARLLA